MRDLHALYLEYHAMIDRKNGYSLHVVTWQAPFSKLVHALRWSSSDRPGIGDYTLLCSGATLTDSVQVPSCELLPTCITCVARVLAR